MMARLSVVIPVLNEAERLPGLLESLAPLRRGGAEIVVVDGGSHDESIAAARRGADKVLSAARGRAFQLNAGAAAASAPRLLFLHADSRVDVECLRAMRALADAPGTEWGFFRVRLTGRSPLLGLVALLMWWRSRFSGIATGDQGLFVSRSLFEAVDGYPPQRLMEDVEICRRLRRIARPRPIAIRLGSSARRWDRDGVLRTILLMWWLRLRYFLGASPDALHRVYYGG